MERRSLAKVFPAPSSRGRVANRGTGGTQSFAYYSYISTPSTRRRNGRILSELPSRHLARALLIRLAGKLLSGCLTRPVYAVAGQRETLPVEKKHAGRLMPPVGALLSSRIPGRLKLLFHPLRQWAPGCDPPKAVVFLSLYARG
jgi:hypothetical protein